MKRNLSAFERLSLTVGLSLVTTIAFAQNKPDDKKPAQPQPGAVTEEIIERPYKPVLADAVKIRRSPDLENSKPFKPNLSYAVVDKRLELNSDIRQLQAQQLAEEKELTLRNNYAKIGIGNYNTGLGEVYINNGKDPALQTGFFFKHLNQKGNLNSQKLSRQQAGIFGRSILDKLSINGALNYDRLATNFYGYDAAQPLANPDPEKERYNVIQLTGEALKKYTDDDTQLNYALKLDAYLLNNIADKRERSFAVSGLVNKVIKKFNIGANVSADFTSSRDELVDISNNILRANPYVKLQGDTYKLIVGLNLISEFGTATRTNVLPAVTAEFPVVPNFATIFGGITGDVNKTSLLDLSRENPYLSPNINILNSVEKTNIHAGVKGNAGAGFGYKIMAFHKSVNNLPLFINNRSQFQRFDVIYDNGKSKITGLEGEISVQTSETFTWTGKARFMNYKLASEAEAWFRPGLEVSSEAKFRINKKLILDASALIYGDSNGATYTTNTTTPELRVVSIKSFVDLSAGAEYQIKDKIGVYVRANNLFGTQYQRYLYYPKFGLNVFGGFNYSF